MAKFTCIVCGKQKINKTRFIGKYCSWECRRNFFIPPIKFCTICKKEFFINLRESITNFRKRKCCSPKCRQKYASRGRMGRAIFGYGENHPRWKGNKYSENYRQRRIFRISLQKSVFQRDNYTCQICGSRKDLQVDHIQSWAEYIELRFKLENCRTVCAQCHYKITFGKPMPEKTKGWGHNLFKGGDEK